jgi:hypothetical protein
MAGVDPSATTPPAVEVSREADLLRVRFSGAWSLAAGIPGVESAARQLEAEPRVARLALEADSSHAWDSALVSAAYSLCALASARGAEIDTSACPRGRAGCCSSR